MQRRFIEPSPRAFVRKIVSGAQTGADRAGLDVAIELGIDHGGWVPRGRLAEDGPLPRRYQLRETSSAIHSQRTERNVRDSDATIIFSHGPLRGGSALTLRVARRLKKPAKHINLARLSEPAAARTVREWLTKVQPTVLNVAGPRASSDPKIYDAVYRLLTRLFRE